MKKIFSIFLFLFCSIIFGQEVINNYKYIIVPKQFDAFKNENQYETSTLVKYLFSEKGFDVFYNDKIPASLNVNRCSALWVTLDDSSKMFATRISIVLKDCDAKEIYRTKEGMSRIKGYKEAYSEAIRDAFSSFSGYTYAYSSKMAKPITVSFKNDVKNLPIEKTVKPVVENEVVKIDAPVAIVEVDANMSETKLIEVYSESSLYPQNILNGYQLVDSTPKIVMKIFKTSQPNIYLGEEINGSNGLVYNKNGIWIFEYYEGDNLKEKIVNIKF
jgi:hypothetical protein